MAGVSVLFFWKGAFAVVAGGFSFSLDSAAVFVEVDEGLDDFVHFLIVFLVGSNAHQHVLDFCIFIFLLLADSSKSPEKAFSLVVFP